MKSFKYSPIAKFLLFLLASLAFVTAVTGAAGMALLEKNGLYVDSLNEHLNQQYDSISRYIAEEYATRYAAKWLGQCSDNLIERLYGNDMYFSEGAYHWQVELWQDNMRIDQTLTTIEDPIYREYTFHTEYPIATKKNPISDDVTEEEDTEDKEDGELTPPLYVYDRTVWEGGELITYRLHYYESPVYTVKISISPDIIRESPGAVLVGMYQYRFAFIGILILGILIYAACLVALIWFSGIDPEGKLRPCGLNLLPVDIYAAIVAGAAILYTWIISILSNWSGQDGFTPAILTIMALSTLVVSLLITGFFCAIAAQVRGKDGYWWKHSFLYFIIKHLWQISRFCFRGLQSLYAMMSVLWQWLLTAGLLLFSVIGFSVATQLLTGFWLKVAQLLLFLSLAGCMTIVIYGGYALGKLLSGAKKIVSGDFNHKISTRYLSGCFLDFAKDLNSLSEISMNAAKQQLKSERMKTELITNVSHDIKTPLTSIINFVDLLQKPHTQEEETQYLEILARQSGRMKKLIEDLIDLSKASTGNLPVHLKTINASEAVTQALGEFTDRLKAVPLEPVFTPPKGAVMMQADGKLCWRVLSNLLSNAVKYAMPGTRLFIDLHQTETSAVISLKNVSRAPLTMAAEELMERFVQGDVSRNTEGSGLGLNIAKSLMEIQHGNLDLIVEADLFKVTLTFPLTEHS